MGSIGVLASFAGIPREHVAGCANRPFRIKYRHQGKRIPKVNDLANMLHDLAHVQSDDDSPSYIVLIEQGWIYTKPVALYKALDQSNELRQQVVAVSFPCRLHLVEDIGCRREYDSLCPKAPAQFLQVDLGEPRDVGLALEDWSQFGSGSDFVRVQG